MIDEKWAEKNMKLQKEKKLTHEMDTMWAYMLYLITFYVRREMINLQCTYVKSRGFNINAMNTTIVYV